MGDLSILYIVVARPSSKPTSSWCNRTVRLKHNCLGLDLLSGRSVHTQLGLASSYSPTCCILRILHRSAAAHSASLTCGAPNSAKGSSTYLLIINSDSDGPGIALPVALVPPKDTSATDSLAA